MRMNNRILKGLRLAHRAGRAWKAGHKARSYRFLASSMGLLNKTDMQKMFASHI